MSDEVNIPALRKAVEWAEAEAAKPWELCEWYQGSYVQAPENTDMLLSADDPRMFESKYATPWYNSNGKLEWVQYNKAPDCGTCYCIAGYVAQAIVGIKDNIGLHSHDAARKELGLSVEQADRLFAAGNSIEDVRELAESFAGEKL